MKQLTDTKAAVKYTMKDVVAVTAGIYGSPKGLEVSCIGASAKLYAGVLVWQFLKESA